MLLIYLLCVCVCVWVDEWNGVLALSIVERSKFSWNFFEQFNRISSVVIVISNYCVLFVGWNMGFVCNLVSTFLLFWFAYFIREFLEFCTRRLGGYCEYRESRWCICLPLMSRMSRNGVAKSSSKFSCGKIQWFPRWDDLARISSNIPRFSRNTVGFWHCILVGPLSCIHWALSTYRLPTIFFLFVVWLRLKDWKISRNSR